MMYIEEAGLKKVRNTYRRKKIMDKIFDIFVMGTGILLGVVLIWALVYQLQNGPTVLNTFISGNFAESMIVCVSMTIAFFIMQTLNNAFDSSFRKVAKEYLAALYSDYTKVPVLVRDKCEWIFKNNPDLAKAECIKVICSSGESVTVKYTYEEMDNGTRNIHHRDATISSIENLMKILGVID